MKDDFDDDWVVDENDVDMEKEDQKEEEEYLSDDVLDNVCESQPVRSRPRQPMPRHRRSSSSFSAFCGSTNLQQKTIDTKNDSLENL